VRPQTTTAADSIATIAEQLLDIDADSALRVSKDLRSIARGPHTGPLRARLFEIEAHALFKEPDMVAALTMCDSALIYYRANGDSLAVGRLELLKGKVYLRLGYFEGASEALESVLDRSNGTGDHAILGECHRTLGQLHYYQRQFDQARDHYELALSEYSAARDELGISRVYNNLGVLEAESDVVNGYANGLRYYRSALLAAERAGSDPQRASVHDNLALIHLYDRNEFVPSKMHFDSAMFFAGRAKDSVLYYSILEDYAEYFIHKGDQYKAIELSTRSLKFAERHHILVLRRDATQSIALALRFAHQWSKSCNMLESYYRLRDSTYNASSRETILKRALLSENKRRAISDSIASAAKLDQATKRATIASLQADRNRGRVLVLGGLVAALALGGGLYFRLDRRRRRAKYQRDTAQLELKALRAQMNPHFIFNALSSINDYVLENERDIASGYLTKFARLMRLVLENSRKPMVSLAKDLEALQLYIDLECLRTNKSFEHVIHTDPDIDPTRMIVPPMAIQPFVENAIRHGLAKKEGKGHLRVSVQKRSDHLVVTVEDDGVGMKRVPLSQAGNERTALGTAITAERLAMLSEKLGAELGFRYIDVPIGVCVEVTLPLTKGA
jgi:tetratricopeptide (TPR) repeat protein